MKERNERNEASVSSYNVICWLCHMLIAVTIILISSIWMWMLRSCDPLWENRPVPRPCYQLIKLLRRHPRPCSRILLKLVMVGVDPDLASVVGGLLVRHML